MLPNEQRKSLLKSILSQKVILFYTISYICAQLFKLHIQFQIAAYQFQFVSAVRTRITTMDNLDLGSHCHISLPDRLYFFVLINKVNTEHLQNIESILQYLILILNTKK